MTAETDWCIDPKQCVSKRCAHWGYCLREEDGGLHCALRAPLGDELTDEGQETDDAE